MTGSPSYYIGLELSRSQYCTAVAIAVEEPVWIGPDSERRLVVLRSG
jgi:hypothetical protein